MKKALPFILAILVSGAPLLVSAQTSTVGSPCDSPAQCMGPNETCDPNGLGFGQGMCILNQAGVNQVVNNGGGGGLNTSVLQSWEQSIVFFINNVLVPLLTAIAFIVFLWGVFNYFIWGADNEEKRKEGKTFVMYGIIGFVIIFSLWGLVNVGISLLNVGTGGRPAGLPYPTL